MIKIPILLIQQYLLYLQYIIIGVWQSLINRSNPTSKPFKPKQYTGFKNQPKSQWTIRRIIHLKALMPDISSRSLADAFNRQHGQRDTVSHQTVCKYLRVHQADVSLKRKHLRKRKAFIGINNHVWGVDLTGKHIKNNTHWILGIVDHGTRSSITLQVIKDKSSLTLLQALLGAIEHFGKPKVIRTDNESVFCSRLFRFALKFLGIQHQTTDLHCPWQNGRIERLFGTLKEKLNQIEVCNVEALALLIKQFRFWYNHVRTHQSLLGYTPAEVWNRKHPKNIAIAYRGWNGLLTGFYHPP